MIEPFIWLIPGIWVVWWLYWRYAAAGVKPAVRRESAASRASHIVPLVLGAMLLAVPTMSGWFAHRLIPADPHWLFWLGVAVQIAGLALAILARSYLGRNWSGTVTLKQGHELIRTGPYRYVRHPIYTGLLLAFIGSALARNEWRGALAVVLVLAAFWRKLSIEERWLAELFGESYAAYRRETAALIPLLI